jgi:hypothetical protein
MATKELIAPSAWVSAIVNRDYSGLDRDEIATLNNFLVWFGVSFADCLTCKDAGFVWRHDATDFTRTGADCQVYTFKM